MAPARNRTPADRLRGVTGSLSVSPAAWRQTASAWWPGGAASPAASCPPRPVSLPRARRRPDSSAPRPGPAGTRSLAPGWVRLPSRTLPRPRARVSGFGGTDGLCHDSAVLQATPIPGTCSVHTVSQPASRTSPRGIPGALRPARPRPPVSKGSREAAWNYRRPFPLFDGRWCVFPPTCQVFIELVSAPGSLERVKEARDVTLPSGR